MDAMARVTGFLAWFRMKNPEPAYLFLCALGVLACVAPPMARAGVTETAQAPLAASAPVLLDDSLSVDVVPLLAQNALGLQFEHRAASFMSVVAYGQYMNEAWLTKGADADTNYSTFDLELACRIYPGGEALRHFYVGPGVALWCLAQPQVNEAFDYQVGPELQLGYVWVPFNAWSIDLGGAVEGLDNVQSGFPDAAWFSGFHADLWLRMGYAWGASTNGNSEVPVEGAPLVQALPSIALPWDVSLRPFAGYTTLAMSNVNRNILRDGYSSAINRGMEFGLEAPFRFGGFTVGPRVYVLSSNTSVSDTAGTAGSEDGSLTLFAFPIELGVGYAWRLGAWSLDAGLYGGAMYGYWDDQFVDSDDFGDQDTVENYGGAWTGVEEAQAGVHYALGDFCLGADVGYRYAVVSAFDFTRAVNGAPTFTRQADNSSGGSEQLDFSGTSLLGSVGYRF